MKPIRIRTSANTMHSRAPQSELTSRPRPNAAALLLAAVVFSASLCLGQSSPPSPSVSAPSPSSAFTDPEAARPQPASLGGTVVDQSGAIVTGAQVSLVRENHSINQQALTGTDGQFLFTNIDPGPYRLIITAVGFGTQTTAGVLRAAEISTIPQIALTIAENVTEVSVGVSQVEVAEEQIKVEEKQRVLGAIPNFFVTYDPKAVPLDARQKFELAARSIIDPFTFAVVAGTSGVQQAQNHFREYGQGTQGYAKRFGAVYADTVTGTFIGGAILPSLLKQDPRYFYKGTGSTGSRALYAIANAFICKGDNRRWQPNYSNVLGNLASGAISNLYYPSEDRSGLDLTFENAGIGVGATAITNLLQEFLIRHLTPKAPKN